MHSRLRGRSLLCALILAALLTACASGRPHLADVARGTMITTGGPNRSMIYAIDTDAGVALIDIGWWDARGELRSALAELGHDSSAVVAVFVTHSHRDHIAGWPLVPHATFYMAEAEVDEFFGQAPFEGWIPRAADRLKEPRRPAPGEVEVHSFSADTAIVIGGDTIRAFPVPGHTDGTAVYLVRGVLFVGDALSQGLIRGFRDARGGYSDDAAQARLSFDDLLRRLAPYRVEVVCTAHAHCGRFDEEFPPGASE